MRLASLASLLFASFTGKLVYAVASIAALPLVAKMLGAESVGLVGFFNTLLMVLMVLEGGLTSSIIQRLAKVKHDAAWLRAERSVHAMLGTYLVTFFVLGCAVAVAVYCSAEVLVAKWLNLQEVSVDSAVHAVRCMAVFIGLNLPVMLLQAIFVGREKQHALNILFIPYSLMRTLGVVGVIAIIPALARIDYYFSIQVLVQVLYVIGLLVVLVRLGLVGTGRLRFKYLLSGMAFSRGVFFVSLTSVFTMQYDKLYLSGALSLGDYAKYSLAATIASFPYIFSTALNSVLFPRFSKNFRVGDLSSIERVFRAAVVLIALLMTILCSVVYWFGAPLLNLVFEHELAQGVADVLPVLMMGTALQSLLIVPYALQLAASWTSLSFRLNLVAIPLIAVMLPIGVAHYGALGGGYTWLIYNVLSLAATVYFVCRRYPDLWHSFRFGVLVVLSVGAVVNVIFFTYHYWFTNSFLHLTILSGGVGIFTLLGALFFRSHLSGLR